MLDLTEAKRLVIKLTPPGRIRAPGKNCPRILPKRHGLHTFIQLNADATLMANKDDIFASK